MKVATINTDNGRVYTLSGLLKAFEPRINDTDRVVMTEVLEFGKGVEYEGVDGKKERFESTTKAAFFDKIKAAFESEYIEYIDYVIDVKQGFFDMIPQPFSTIKIQIVNE